MHYNSLLVTLTLASTMASVTSAGVVQKRFCNDGRQFCCAVEEVPDAEILPNLYLFVYGIGCKEIPINENCDTTSSQPHGMCCGTSDTQTGPLGTVFCFSDHA